MPPRDKRERQRANRQEAMSRYTAERRRQRTFRLTATLVVLLLIVGIALFAGVGKGGKSPSSNNTTPSSNPSAGAAAENPGCNTITPPKPTSKQYKSAPKKGAYLKAGVDYGAVIHTSCGDIKMDLLEKDAPITVNN